MVADTTRITVVEDHALLAESLRMALDAEGFAVATVLVAPDARDSTELLLPILATRPDVVLLDLDLGVAGDGAHLIQPLRGSGCDIVVVTGSTDDARWGECLASGAHAVLPKSARLERIEQTVRQVAGGHPAIDTQRRDELILRWQRHRARQHSTRSRLERLTERERQVLSALTRGSRVRDIARESFVSESTVRTQVKSILAKLEVSSQIAAVAIARDADRGHRG